jgi:hypothetical protein
LHPTRTRVWCRKGRRAQRLVAAPGATQKVYGCGLGEGRAGWCDGRGGPQRTAALFGAFCAQLRAAVARSRQRGRVAIVLADNLRPPTPRGSRLVRALRAEAQGSLRLVYAPRYAPEAHRSAWLWRIVRQAVPPHHHRAECAVLLDDRWNECEALTQRPTAVLAPIGSPGVLND